MAVKIFFCYTHEDEIFLNSLKAHLKPFQRRDLIESWHDRDISAGTEWEQKISKHLDESQIILLLVSQYFMNSDYSYAIEMKRALERHERGEACVIPIILRPIYWKRAPFSKLQVLPTDSKPVTSHPNRDEALWDVTTGVLKIINEMLKQECINNAKKYLDEGRFEQAIFAYQQAIRIMPIMPKDASLYHEMGDILSGQKQYEAAVEAYTNAILLDSDKAQFYMNKGDVLFRMAHYEEALSSYENAIHLDPGNAQIWGSRARCLACLKRLEEALASYEQTLRLDPKNPYLYKEKGDIHLALERWEEALASYENAIRLSPEFALAYLQKSVVLRKLAEQASQELKHRAEEAYRRVQELEHRSSKENNKN